MICESETEAIIRDLVEREEKDFMSMRMMTLLTFMVVLLTVLCIVLIVYIAVNLISKNNSNKGSNSGYNPYEDSHMIEMLSNFDFNKITDTIDTFINEAGEEYKLDHFAYLPADSVYLNEETMNDMIKYIVNQVMFRITAQVFTIIKMSYNIKTEEDLIGFLYKRARKYVLAYSIKANAEVE